MNPVTMLWGNLSSYSGFSGGASGKKKKHACQYRRCEFDPWARKIPWRREWQPTSVLLPGEFHGQRSLVGYSPRDLKESDMTEQLIHTHTHTHFRTNLTSFTVRGDCMMPVVANEM